MNKKKFLLNSFSKSELADKIIELEKIADKVIELEKTVIELEKLNDELQDKIKQQDDQLRRNSQNSNKPPSTDLYAKACRPRSEREKSGKKSGGQPGHKGVTLEQVENPDHTETYDCKECTKCNYDLSEIQANEYTRHQEVDIPLVKPKITEHRFSSKTCPECKTVNAVEVPSHLAQPIQYGPGIQTLATYASYELFVPLRRTQNLLFDLFGLKISEGSLVSMHDRTHNQLQAISEKFRSEIASADSIHFDETSMYINGQTQWLHSASTPKMTHYLIHSKRGSEAIEEMKILPDYKGIAIHDHWKAYFKYPSKHALCNAHHIRELRSMYENYSQQWALDMRNFLLSILKIVEQCKDNNKTELPAETLKELSEKYDAILEKALAEIPQIDSLSPKKPGRTKQHPAKNLYDRLTRYKIETLRFMDNFNIPFTNNQAEQDVRMAKVKQKISGCFRSTKGAERFCRIRGYISTAKKMKMNVFTVLENAARGQPELSFF